MMKKLHILWMVVLSFLMVAMMVYLVSCSPNEPTYSGGVGGDNSDLPPAQSKGLDFEKIEDTEEYAVVGIGSCDEATISIPKTYKNKPVTTIAATAFTQECQGVSEIYVPDSIKTIENGAFSGCTSLKKVTIPVLSGRLSVYFGDAGVPTTLKTVILTTMTSVPTRALSGCVSLEEVVFPANATNLGWACLEGCKNIKKITTPFVGSTMYDSGSKNRELRPHPFTCNDAVLTDVNAKGYAPHLYNFFGVRATCIYNYNSGYRFSFDAPPPFGNDYISVDYKDLIPSTSISLTITSGYVTNYACRDTKVGEVILEGELTTAAKGIGYNAFESCSSLTSITISSEITTIGHNAFEGCSSLAAIAIPNSVTKIETESFLNCSKLVSVTIPTGIIEVKDDTFSGCTSLTSVTLPSNLTKIGADAFSNCSSLASINIPDSVVTIEGNAFAGCASLASIILPRSITEINRWTFRGCTSLVSVSIPNSVTDICYEAFKDCKSLSDVTIPRSVRSIEARAFYGCVAVSFEDAEGWNAKHVDFNSGSIAIDDPEQTVLSGNWALFK